jgi:hypothetical protein
VWEALCKPWGHREERVAPVLAPSSRGGDATQRTTAQWKGDPQGDHFIYGPCLDTLEMRGLITLSAGTTGAKKHVGSLYQRGL